MIALSLQSGSNGNCIYVETDGVKLLFDAGICGIKAETRLKAYGRDIRDVDALIISHDHADHVFYAGVFQRKYGLPIYMTPRTLQRTEREKKIGKLKDVRFFRSGDNIDFGPVSVRTIPTPHDADDGSAFVLCSGSKRLGILTDLGHAFEELFGVIASLDGVFIESNYDPDMLAKGSYPAFLKRRIQGPGGHLSNREAAELLLTGTNLTWACLAHLSGNNNNPQVALRTHCEILGRRFPLHIAGRNAPSGILTL
ncbi:MAG: MBL fold metallo-hydrolase [Nitrospirota bacterium]